MAYCSNCGAYIPDGKTVCMACGASVKNDNSGNPAAAGKSSSAQAFQQEKPQTGSSSPSSDELRQQLEEKRRKQQEQSREWAEKAYSDYKNNTAHSTSARTDGRPYSEKEADASSKKTLGKVLSVLSYISVGCFLPFIVTRDDEFAKFHGKQGSLLFILSIIIDILGGLKSIAFVLGAARIYLAYVGIRNVLNDRMEKLPYIGKYADRF